MRKKKTDINENTKPKKKKKHKFLKFLFVVGIIQIITILKLHTMVDINYHHIQGTINNITENYL